MSEALTLHQLAGKAEVLARKLADGKVHKDADNLRERIEGGYAKVADAIDEGKSTEVLQRARAKIAELEEELKRTEWLLVAHYFEQVFLMIQRDVLRKFSTTPKDSKLRVLLPGALDMTVRLDNLPEEPPF